MALGESGWVGDERGGVGEIRVLLSRDIECQVEVQIDRVVDVSVIVTRIDCFVVITGFNVLMSKDVQ
jgi:hypothetical protein